MNTIAVLDELWHTYLVTIDCLQIARRSVKRKDIASIQGTEFMEAPQDAAMLQITACRKSTEDYFVLAFWASFERNLLDFLKIECRKIMGTQPSAFNQKLHRKIEDQLEYWRSDEILDIFKMLVDSNLIGQAKKIKRYRDWVAHKNPNKPSPDNVTPQIAYDVLSNITKQLDKHTALSSTNIVSDTLVTKDN